MSTGGGGRLQMTTVGPSCVVALVRGRFDLRLVRRCAALLGAAVTTGARVVVLEGDTVVTERVATALTRELARAGHDQTTDRSVLVVLGTSPGAVRDSVADPGLLPADPWVLVGAPVPPSPGG